MRVVDPSANRMAGTNAVTAARKSVLDISYSLSLFCPQDVIDNRRIATNRPQPSGALSAMMLAVHDDLQQRVARRQVGIRRPWQGHWFEEVRFRKLIDESQLSLVGVVVKALEFLKRPRNLPFFRAVERALRQQGQEPTLHQDHVVQCLAQRFVISGSSVLTDGFENGRISPGLVLEQRLNHRDHAAIVARVYSYRSAVRGSAPAARRAAGIAAINETTNNTAAETANVGKSRGLTP